MIASNSLRDLSFTGNVTFETATGWETFCSTFAHPLCSIQRLSFTNTEIGDGGATILGGALANNKSVKGLDFCDDLSVTSVGWQGFSTCLRNPNSSLEVISIGGGDIGHIDDEGANAIISALTNNTTLKKLDLLPYGCIDRWFMSFFSRLVWDKSSIDNTYSSNHTLYKIDLWPRPKGIRQLANMNRNENKVEVARQKILQYHFADGDANIHVFASTPEPSLPFAIEWIGRNSDGRTLMYHFVRAIPTLFGVMLSL